MKKLLLAGLLSFGVAFGEVIILNTFNGGELSPHLNSRIDFQKYQSGLRTMENFIVLPYGGALKRSGTQYIAPTKSNGVARLAPFSVGVDQTYMMELGEGYIRFFRNGVQIESGGVPIEVVTPYLSSEVFEVQMTQFADTMYLVHPAHPVQLLTRESTDPVFAIEEVQWSWPPLLDENDTDITITPSATTGTVTLTSSEDLFTTNHVGSAWVLRSAREGGSIETNWATASVQYSNAIRVEGDWNFKTSGTWDGTVIIQVSEDGQSTWADYRSYISANDANYDRDGTELEAGVYYRIKWDGDSSDAIDVNFQNTEPYLSGWATITEYVSPTQVRATVESSFGSTKSTKLWSEGAFSDELGYPKTVEFFENRLFFGGTPYLVNTIWASMTDNHDNFKTGTYDDSSLRIGISSDNIIEWMLGQTSLFIGTFGDEWTLSGGDANTPLTPSSIVARRRTSFGSKDGMDALLASDTLIYLQRQGLKLREFEYSLEIDSYKSSDLTILAEHITRGGIAQFADQQQPEPIIWAIRKDGQLIGLTYSKVQNVFGWHRHVTDGEFESVGVIPSDGEDRVYVIVNRENGRFVEWFAPIDWGDDDEDAWFVDSGLDYDGGDAVSISDFTLGTNTYAILGQAKVPVEYDYTDGTGAVYDGHYANLDSVPSYYFQWIGRFPDYTNGYWSIRTEPRLGSDPLYAGVDTSEADAPPYEPWVYYSSIIGGDGVVTTDGKFYQKGVSVVAGNSFSDGDLIRLSGDGGLYIASFGDGVFISTNCTTTDFEILYKNDSSQVFGYGSYTGGVTAIHVKNTFTNVAHLAGQTVDIYADGGVLPDEVISDEGVLTLDTYQNRVIAGLPYTARLSPMYLDSVSDSASTYGKLKSPYKALFRVNKSGGFNYGPSEDRLDPVTVRTWYLTAGSAVPFLSGDRRFELDTITPSTSPEFWMTSDQPLPLEILSVGLYIKVTEME